MYAIIETGGKQYNVKIGDKIKIEKIAAEAGQNYTFENVVLVSKDENVQVGEPFLAGASVVASVLEQNKHKKVIVYKYKSKKGYHKKKGHRQPYTSLKIDAINA